MKERPILFSGEMVRAILDGRKTQTRRVIKHDARGADRVRWIENGQNWPGRKGDTYIGWVAEVDKLGGASGLHLPLTCPYGKPGDRLWVGEAHRHLLSGYGNKTVYRADAALEIEEFVKNEGGWTPGIHMFRQLSRINLEITNVRVERLQDISEEDAKAEGVEEWSGSGNSARYKFLSLWNTINGKKHPWGSNPWVWVIEFRRIDA